VNVGPKSLLVKGLLLCAETNIIIDGDDKAGVEAVEAADRDAENVRNYRMSTQTLHIYGHYCRLVLLFVCTDAPTLPCVAAACAACGCSCMV
jgi:hypothetical protein